MARWSLLAWILLSAVARPGELPTNVTESDEVGSRTAEFRFSEFCPPGSVLLGVEATFGTKANGDPIIYALRPVYGLQGQYTGTRFYGQTRVAPPRQPGNSKLPPKLHPRLLGTQRLLAPPGTVVTELHLREHSELVAVALSYAPLDEDGLHFERTGRSAWLGAGERGRERSIGHYRSVIVGLFGSYDKDRLRSLGVYQFFLPRTLAAPDLKPRSAVANAAPHEMPAPPPEDAAADAAVHVDAAVSDKAVETPEIELESQDTAEAEEAAPAVAEASPADELWWLWLLGTALAAAIVGGYFLVNAVAHRKDDAESIPTENRVHDPWYSGPRGAGPAPAVEAELDARLAEEFGPADRTPDGDTSIDAIPPPYFNVQYHAAGKRFRGRTYLLPEELFCVPIGPLHPQSAGLAGGLLGAVMGLYGAHLQRQANAQREKLLDGATCERLRRMALEDRGGFGCRLDQETELRVTEATWWQAFLGQAKHGFLRLNRPGEKPLLLAFEGAADRSLAVQLLDAFAPDQLQTTW